VTVAPSHRWSDHLRGHLLLFDRKPSPALSADTGVGLLLTAALLEIVRIAVVPWLRAGVPLSLLLAVLLGFALLVVAGLGGIKLSQLGLRPWRDWTTTEKSYFLQVVVIANVVFPVVLAVPFRSRASSPDLASSLWNVFVPYLFFGFYQELVYRGMVQRELVRRWGAPVGILVANVLYTFGPLHWNYFASPTSLALPMFAAIFAIGLFFGAACQRSGNLWIVAVFHAIGNAYIVWGAGAPS
jgi:uncharacterized protein